MCRPEESRQHDCGSTDCPSTLTYPECPEGVVKVEDDHLGEGEAIGEGPWQRMCGARAICGRGRRLFRFGELRHGGGLSEIEMNMKNANDYAKKDGRVR